MGSTARSLTSAAPAQISKKRRSSLISLRSWAISVSLAQMCSVGGLAMQFSRPREGFFSTEPLIRPGLVPTLDRANPIFKHINPLLDFAERAKPNFNRACPAVEGPQNLRLHIAHVLDEVVAHRLHVCADLVAHRLHVCSD